MRLLLDTHFVLWVVAQRNRLTAAEIVLINGAADLVISSASLWELRLKWDRLHPSGARKGPVDPGDLLEAILRGPYVLLALTPEHAVTPLTVSLQHRDPFDELLLAQAQAEGLRLLTRDRALVGHPLAVTG